MQCLDESAVGRGGLVAVVGEVGIGTTRLARDLADHARSAGMWVLVGRAVETGAATPFRALFEALSGYFRQAGTDAHPELERRRSRRCWCPSGVFRAKNRTARRRWSSEKRSSGSSRASPARRAAC
ncbi:MAG: AAA family ATPase [Rhodococcus sp. (in: high G+C Gram-positive bacteria)]